MSCRWREVPLRERAAGAGFQVALETASRVLVGELELYQQSPWTMCSGVAAWTSVVPFETAFHAGRNPNVAARGVRHSPEDIDESQGMWSQATAIETYAPDDTREDLERSGLACRCRMQFVGVWIG